MSSFFTREQALYPAPPGDQPPAPEGRARTGLEHEGRIGLLRDDDGGDLFVRCPDGTLAGLADFLDGQTLAVRRDPDFADLSWDPVSSMSHILSEYPEG